MQAQDSELFGSIEKILQGAGKEGYQSFREQYELSDAQIESMAQLMNHRGHHTIVSIVERRAKAILDALRYEVGDDDKKVLAGFRVWQALSQAVDDLKFFPRMAREAIENKNNPTLESIVNYGLVDGQDEGESYE